MYVIFNIYIQSNAKKSNSLVDHGLQKNIFQHWK